MGSGKKAHRRQGKPQSQLRTRTTRSKGKVLSLSDPAENTQLLTEQLRSLGLYAAPTLGDGNCLFRALSDQLYGSPSRHSQLRQDICDWIQYHKSRYEPFVDDERGLDVHLQCMRQNATYGGHLELSAFAHMTKRNVKVIQPGLVYVIEWDAGRDLSTDDDDADRRRFRRDKKRGTHPQDDVDVSDDASSSSSNIYVAYHDWEHFSSIRNLKGPHAGLPHVQEVAGDDIPPPPPTPPPSKPTSKRLPKVKLKVAAPTTIGIHPPTPLELPVPEDHPLPSSRSCSPPHSSPSPPPQPCPYPLPTTSLSHDYLRVHRSPKRSFDESSAGSGSGSESAAKRTKSHLGTVSYNNQTDDDRDVDADADTPDLSAPGSSSSSSSPDSVASSIASSPMPEPEPPASRPLTRRQRKALGLPKPRSGISDRGGSGTIIIPGGRYKAKRVTSEVGEEADDDQDGEWRRNGAGRVDVRGFRELKI